MTTPACPRCGQSSLVIGEVCDRCREVEREPQGEAFPLFEVPPQPKSPMPGQEGMF